MEPESLPPIPMPPAMRWREFRVRVLPVLFFLLAVVGVGFIWQQNLSAPTLVGAVETRRAQVISPLDGKIETLSVQAFQTVTKGAPLAVLTPTDPRAALDVVRSDLAMLDARFGSELQAQRNETAYDELHVKWLSEKVDLATARVNLELAQDELQRDEALHKEKLLADAIYDSALKTEQALSAEVLERSNLVVITEAQIEQVKRNDTDNAANDSLASALQTEEKKLKAAVAGTQPLVLTAPMDGIVSAIYQQAGENVPAGTLVLTITATRPEHIISYLRQPIPFEPKVGMPMEVRTRTRRIQSGMAYVETVGAQFEAISNSLAVFRPDRTVDLGLPIEVSLPPGMKLHPGEIVDLTLRSAN